VETLIKERPISGIELRFLVSQVYFHCPHCKHEVHSYFTSPRLDEWKEEIQRAADDINALKDVTFDNKNECAAEYKIYRKALIKARARHQTEHDRLQSTMKDIISRRAMEIDLAVLGSWLQRYPDPKLQRQTSAEA
jgi:hypothetical protein